MKIALLTQGLRFNAPEASNITLKLFAEELVKEGHEVVIFCNQIFKQPLIEKISGYKIIRKKATDYNSKYTWNLKLLNYSELVKKEVEESGKEFDIIHNFSASPMLSIRGILAKRFSKKAKLIQTIKAESEARLSYILTPLLNYYDYVITPSNHLKRMLIKKGLKSNKVKIISSYIDAGKFKPRDKNKLKKKYGYEGKKILLYYGHFSEKKGLFDLIDAITILKDEDFKALFITGSGEKFIKPYEKIIRERKLQNRIKIIKTPVKLTKNIEEYVAMADVSVFPYPDLISTEAQPSCILESMASKTAVITSDLPELKEFLTEKEVIFANPKDSKDLAKKIKYALNTKNLKEIITRAYKKSKRFDAKKVIKKYIEIYSN